DVAGHFADAGRLDLFGQILQPRQRVGVGDGRFSAGGRGVDVIAVGEQQLARLVAAAAEVEVAGGAEDQVAVEFAFLLVQFAAQINRRLEAVVGAEFDEGGGAGVELGDGGGG